MYKIRTATNAYYTPALYINIASENIPFSSGFCLIWSFFITLLEMEGGMGHAEQCSLVAAGAVFEQHELCWHAGGQMVALGSARVGSK